MHPPAPFIPPGTIRPGHSVDAGSEPQEFGAVPNTSQEAFKPRKVYPVMTDLFYPTSHPNPNRSGSVQGSQDPHLKGLSRPQVLGLWDFSLQQEALQ